MTLCDYEVDCEPVADLSTDEGRAAHSVAMEDLACPWLSLMLDGKAVPSHEVAKRLESEGYVGILVPSFVPGARPEDVNLVLWKWGEKLPTLVQVHDPDKRLPKDRKSWQ